MNTIAFIGCGNMAQPIIRNVKNKNVFDGKNIFAFDTDDKKLNDFCLSTGVNALKSVEDCAKKDVVVLCVKPQVFPTVLPEIKENIVKNNTLVISIAAGKTTDYILTFLDEKTRICRIFPNLNAEVGEAISAFTGGKNATETDIELTGKIAKSYGEAIKLSEDKFSSFGVLGGCVPAYAFMFIGALKKAGMDNGLDEETSYKAAVQAVLGSAMLLKEKGGDIDEWIKKVCSPGGTTIEGINSLKNDNLVDTVGKAFKASVDRDKELSAK